MIAPREADLSPNVRRSLALGASAFLLVACGGEEEIEPRPSLPGISAGTLVRALTFGMGSVWATAETEERVLRIDPDDRSIAARIQVEGQPRDLVVGEGAVWAATRSSLVRIDPETNEATTVHELDGPPLVPGVTTGDGSVWLSGPRTTMVRIDPGSGEEIASIDLGTTVRAVAFGEGMAWAGTNDSLARIDPALNRVTGTVATPLGTAGVAVGSGNVWVTGESGDEVVRVDPDTLEITARIEAHLPGPIDASADDVWFGFQNDAKLNRVDPTSARVTATVRLDERLTRPIPLSIAIGDTAVWVAVLGGRVLEIDPRTGRVGP
jgi:streptogramin lyase